MITQLIFLTLFNWFMQLVRCIVTTCYVKNGVPLNCSWCVILIFLVFIHACNFMLSYGVCISDTYSIAATQVQRGDDLAYLAWHHLMNWWKIDQRNPKPRHALIEGEQSYANLICSNSAQHNLRNTGTKVFGLHKSNYEHFESSPCAWAKFDKQSTSISLIVEN